MAAVCRRTCGLTRLSTSDGQVFAAMWVYFRTIRSTASQLKRPRRLLMNNGSSELAALSRIHSDRASTQSERSGVSRSLRPSTRHPTAPHGKHEAQTFRITHPFHPLCGQSFKVLVIRHYREVEHVYTCDDDGVRHSFPLSWTSLCEADAFVRISAGRSVFRMSDLLSLVAMIDGFGSTDDANECPGTVKEIMP